MLYSVYQIKRNRGTHNKRSQTTKQMMNLRKSIMESRNLVVILNVNQILDIEEMREKEKKG